MLFNFINWIFSWWNKPQLLITEDPVIYLKNKLQSDGHNTMYIRKGTLYYNMCPPIYDIKINVNHNMSNIIIDNNIANVRSIIYDDERPVWPIFTGIQPNERWSTHYLLYFLVE